MMEKLIADFPANIDEALEIAKNSTFQKPTKEIHNIVFCGMGGSGFGGKLVAKWIEDEIKLPFIVVQDYTIPNFVNENTLVIGSSYSGNTEETLISIEAARSKGAHIVCISSGGKLKAFCDEHNYDCVVVPGGNPPRTALAYSMVQIGNILVQHGFINGRILDQMAGSGELLRAKIGEIQQEGRKLAEFMHGKFPMIYTETKYEPIAIRARQQFNENSKILCACNPIPEMNHNELVGWGGGDNRYAALFMYTSDMHPRNRRRMEINHEVISQRTPHTYQLNAVGNNCVEESIYLIHILDWASFYLTDINGADVIEIRVIDHLKGELAKF
ncbi:MAG: bifunctional phosphoglucose/phosphomannose isomerase [Bacteroidetes bacterium]|nr:MAG: bifunctional phosphoglucose/phosphomannose isomerase [Bacteroidota bacterium]